METLEERRQRVHREKQLSNRLQLATTRLEAAQQERLWAIVAAYEAGLSIRKIAAATGLSSSRVHQLLSDEEAREVPQWLSLLRQPESSSRSVSDFWKNYPCDTKKRLHTRVIGLFLTQIRRFLPIHSPI